MDRNEFERLRIIAKEPMAVDLPMKEGPETYRCEPVTTLPEIKWRSVDKDRKDG